MQREDVSSPLGNMIRRVREERGVSLRQLAKAAGISSTYLSEIERGWIERPGADVLKKLARELSVSAAQLFSLSESATPEVLKAAQKHPDEFAALAKAFSNLNRREAELFASKMGEFISAVQKEARKTSG